MSSGASAATFAKGFSGVEGVSPVVEKSVRIAVPFFVSYVTFMLVGLEVAKVAFSLGFSFVYCCPLLYFLLWVICLYFLLFVFHGLVYGFRGVRSVTRSVVLR